MKLDALMLQSMQVAKAFEPNKARINSVSFSDDGEHVVTSGNDDSIQLYSALGGRHVKTQFSKKYGANLVQFTHSSTAVVHSSTKENNVLRYLSLHDNRYLRYFSGHKDRVTTLSMSPVSDTFLSAAVDGSVRLWDLRSSNCQGALNVTPGPAPTAAFDPAGLVFAAGIDSQRLNLYDARDFAQGPFATFDAAKCQLPRAKWTQLRFTPDGQHVVVVGADGSICMVDSFEGRPGLRFGGPEYAAGALTDASLSACGQFLAAGAADGTVAVWDVVKGERAATLKAHNDRAGCIAFNPRYGMLATACSTLCFWVPTEG